MSATRLIQPEINLVAQDDDIEIALKLLENPSGSEKLKRRWLEFDCQKGVHHGKYAEYKNGQRKRVQGGYVGRFDKATGDYATRRVREFIQNHNCHYAERFTKDLDECGIRGIEIENWASGRSVSGFSSGERASGSEGDRAGTRQVLHQNYPSGTEPEH